MFKRLSLWITTMIVFLAISSLWTIDSFAQAVVLPISNSTYSGDLSFTLLDGTSVTPTTTVTTSSTDFSAVASASEISGTILGYMYDTCRYAETPSDVKNGSSGNVIVVTSDLVSSSGTINANIWFIYNNTLYITGKDTISNASRYGDTARTFTLSSTLGEYKNADLTYYGSDGTTHTLAEAAALDEKDLTDGVYYIIENPVEDYITDTSNTDTTTTTFTAHADLIPSSGDLIPASAPWIGSAGSITDIYIGDDVVLSGNMTLLFNANSSMTTPGNVNESLYTSLTNVYLYCDMSAVTQTAGMFARCPALANVYVRDGETKDLNSNVSTAFMFYADESLTNNTDSLINAMDMSGGALLDTEFMYFDCQLISKPSVGSYNMSNVNQADGMFYGAKNASLVCSSSITADYNLYNWDLSNLVSAVCMFNGNPSKDSDGNILVDSPLSDLDPGVSTDVESANVITGSVDIVNWKLSKLQDAYMMFAQNASLTSFDFGELTFSALEIARGMFYWDVNLKNVDMANVSMPVLVDARSMFRKAGSSAQGGNLSMEGSSLPSLNNAMYMFDFAGYTTIDMDGVSSLNTLINARGMFSNNPYLTNLGTDGLSQARFAALQDATMMFMNDTALVKVVTADWGMGSVIYIASMFDNCQSLSSGLDISSWNIGTSLVNMDRAFNNTFMDSFDISGWDTYNVVGWFMTFANNSALKKVTMPTNTDSMNSALYLNGLFYNDPVLTTVTYIAPAAACTDYRGMFAKDSALTSVDVDELVDGGVLSAVSFMFANASSLKDLDLSKWDTSYVAYIEGLCDGCTSLVNITVGDGFVGTRLVSIGRAFKDNYKLTTSSLQAVIDKLASTPALTDAYEAFMNAYGLTSLDLSAMDFSNTTVLTRMAAMESNSSYTTTNLVTIKVPSSILTASGIILEDTDDGNGKSINMFYVEGDETSSDDDTVTTFFVNGSVGSNLAAYNFGGTNGDNDNRSFVTLSSKTINGKEVSSYALVDNDDTAVMAVEVTSSFYIGGTDTSSASLLSPSYTWKKDGTTVSGATESSYTANHNNTGTYIANAVPDFSTLTGSNSAISAQFIVGAPVTSIVATYNGDDITVGKTYSKDDVTVKAIDEDGNSIILSSSDWTVDSQTVKKAGTNTYTVTYTTDSGALTTTFTVNGIRRIGSIDVTYSGPSVLVGNKYSTEYISATAYYYDDTTKSEGFEIKPTAYSTSVVSSIGDNTITATYYDSDSETTFADTFVVNGYKAIKSVAATYTGDSIEVGSKYATSDVIMTLYYADGSGSSTTSNFTVDSQTVTSVGANSFVATYRDPYGNTYSATFSVPGYKGATSASATTSTSSSVNAPSTTSTGSTTSGANAVSRNVATSSGIVQTGTTEKLVFYFVVLIVGIAALVLGITFKKKNK